MIPNKCFKTDDGRMLEEHRYIMEQHLKRRLNTDEVVHHINGNHNDNRIENLIIMSHKEHSELHGKLVSENGRPELRKADDDRKIKKNVSLSNNIIEKGEKRATEMGMSFSTYITMLINLDAGE